jgi:single-strand DNA-binding protein
MGKLNKVQLIGNFGDAIQMHHFDGGGCIGRVSLATTETYTKKDTNEKVENVEWHNVVFRNKQAEIIEKYTEKGSKMFVEGRLKYRKWDDKDGVTRYSTEIIVKEFEFLSASKKADNQTQTTSSAGPVPPQGENDDLPF